MSRENAKVARRGRETRVSSVSFDSATGTPMLGLAPAMFLQIAPFLRAPGDESLDANGPACAALGDTYECVACYVVVREPRTEERADRGKSMTILRIVNRHADWDTYDAIETQVDIEHHHPLGLIMHAASEVNGSVQVAQVWDSEEFARCYDETVLKPALEAVGAPVDADITVFELHHLVTP